MKRLFAAGILILLVINAALLSACIDTAPRTVNVTPGPTAEPLVQESPVPTEAAAQLQTRDGNYLLVLAPGENVVFAHILTDMTLMDKEFTLEFDTSVGVHPQQ